MTEKRTEKKTKMTRLNRTTHCVSRLAIVLMASIVVHGPRVAEACSVCTAGRDEENQLAFLLSTIGMSLMPLIAIGTLVFVLWRRIQKLEAETAAGRQPTPLHEHAPRA
jgi:hypothetical protein